MPSINITFNDITPAQALAALGALHAVTMPAPSVAKESTAPVAPVAPEGTEQAAPVAPEAAEQAAPVAPVKRSRKPKEAPVAVAPAAEETQAPAAPVIEPEVIAPEVVAPASIEPEEISVPAVAISPQEVIDRAKKVYGKIAGEMTEYLSAHKARKISELSQDQLPGLLAIVEKAGG